MNKIFRIFQKKLIEVTKSAFFFNQQILGKFSEKMKQAKFYAVAIMHFCDFRLLWSALSKCWPTARFMDFGKFFQEKY